MTLVRHQQKRWTAQLRRRFGDVCVMEWPAFDRGIDRYSPHLDIAVGPFSVQPGQRQTNQYSRLAEQHEGFLARLWDSHQSNERRLNAYDAECAASLDTALGANRNARCFLAIEIENQVSRKHLMGGAINAAALGHLGVLIGWTEDKVRAMFRARSYLNFLASVGKPTMPLANLLILTREQALESLRLIRR